MKIKEIEVSVSLGAVIKEAEYENTKPFFSQKMVVEVDENDDVVEVRKSLRNSMSAEIWDEIDMLRGRLKAELVAQQYKNIRLYPRNGKQYPSVTSVLSWDTEFRCTKDELKQYAAQGNVREELCMHYLTKGEAIKSADELIKLYPKLKKDVVTIELGSLGLKVIGESYIKMLDKCKAKLVINDSQGTVYNDTLHYAGTYDVIGEWEGKKAIIDFKRNSFKWEQLAAYAVTIPDVEVMVILTNTNHAGNKCGYVNPKVETDIVKYFEKFKVRRAEFKERFGI